MQLILEFYGLLFSSTGLSILFLSFTISMILLPLQTSAGRLEQRIAAKIESIDRELQGVRGKLKGEALFLATEEVYKRHHYHPIQSVGIGASILVMLPVLVSAIFMFSGNTNLSEKSFLFIGDLSKPDGLLGDVNVLPLLMSAITLADARLRFRTDKKSQRRFLVVSVVLLAIVYNMASGLVLYWIGSNIASMIINRVRSG